MLISMLSYYDYLFVNIRDMGFNSKWVQDEGCKRKNKEESWTFL